MTSSLGTLRLRLSFGVARVRGAGVVCAHEGSAFAVGIGSSVQQLVARAWHFLLPETGPWAASAPARLPLPARDADGRARLRFGRCAARRSRGRARRARAAVTRGDGWERAARRR